MEDEKAMKSSFLIVMSVRVVSEMLFGLVTFPREMLKVDPLIDRFWLLKIIHIEVTGSGNTPLR